MIVGVTALMMLLCVAVYIPAVQRFAVEKASEIVARETGYRLTIERFRLRFPLGVSVRGATVVTPAGDTLAGVGRARVTAALIPLFKGRVRISDIGLESARVAYLDTVSGMTLRAHIDGARVGSVALDPAGKSVRLARASIDGGNVVLSMGSSGSSSPPPADTLPFDWTIDVRRFELRDLGFAMDMPEDSVASVSPPAFDYRHIRVEGAGITVRDLGFRSGDISARFDGLRLAERSGLTVEDGSGEFAMNADGISLDGFTLQTAGSQIKGSVRAGSGIMDAEGATPVSAQISAMVSTKEIALFAPLPSELQPVLEGRNITMEGSVGGTLDDLTLNDLTAALSPHISVKARGTLRSTMAPESLSGSVTLDGDLANLDFVRSFIPDTALVRRIAIPRRMTLRAAADFSPESYTLRELSLRADTGRLEMKGRFAPRSQTYAADVRLVDFPLGRFLPQDSLGVATLSLTAQGHGYDPASLEATAEVILDRLDYKSIDLGHLAANLSAAEGNITGAIRSRNDLLTTAISLDARIARDTLADPIRQPLPLNYTLAARIDSTVVRLGDDRHSIDPVTLNASASPEGTRAILRSGDLTVDVSSPLPPDSLVRAVARTGSEIERQLARRHFSPDSLQSAFPYMTLTARAGRGNFLHEMARLQGFDFRSASADVSTDAGKPFRIDAVAVGIAAGSFEVDTLGLHALRNGEVLDYRLRLANRPTTMTDLGLISVAGSAGGRSITAGVLQRNSAGVTGFDFGIRATLLDDGTIRAGMEQDPVIGYEHWKVGADSHRPDQIVREENYPAGAGSSEDWIEYGADGHLRADLHLTGTGISTRPVARAAKPALKNTDYSVVGNGALPVAMAAAMAAARSVRHVAVTSDSLPGIPEGALRFVAQGLDLKNLLDILPTAPPVGGVVSSDLTFGFHSDGEEGSIIAAKGSLGVMDFEYNSRRVADIDADVDFGSDGTGSMLLDASVKLEKRPAITAKGTYADGEVDFAVDIPSVPLSIAENLLPDGTARLTGTLDGRVHITGAPSKPALTGDVGFTGAKAEILMIGTTFGISPERITIAGEHITFDNFGLTAPNGRRLAINGGVGIADLSAPTADLSVRARDFQYVNSRHLGGSQIYGTAALNANITARGALDALSVRGDIDLSDDTNIVYILRGDPQKVRDEKQHIVQFVSFADSLAADEGLSPAPLRRVGVDMLLGVNIAEGLKATLSLDELNENRVELIGGGSLSLAMNSQGDTRLVGRYTLSGGTLYYKPPVIPQKIFAVERGSYVEWAGRPMEPGFHVTATQTMDVTLDYDSGEEREVRFEISVDVSGSLSGIDMVFDVAAPGDLLIQDQLLAMTGEGRMQQALTLLIYNQYTGPGVSSKGMAFDARNQLNDFISKEVNQWARNNLKGVDFSMGIDTSDDAAGGSHTDYSYSVSKSLFSDRVKISVGGKVSDEATTSEGFADNLLEDVTLEYRLTRRDNMFLKLYRYNTRESILEGEVTETGAGFVIRRKINRLGDIFRLIRPGRIGNGMRRDSLRINNTGARRPESRENEER